MLCRVTTNYKAKIVETSFDEPHLCTHASCDINVI